MSNYSENEIGAGAGMFEQAMRSQTNIAGTIDRLSPGIAIGLLSAAMRSGLSASQMGSLFDREFGHSAPLLKKIVAMYEGDDWDIDLWNLLPSGQYKVCTDLCRLVKPGWRVRRDTGLADW